MSKMDKIFEKLKAAAEAYYNDQTKTMTDYEFDELKTEWEKKTGKRFMVGAKPKVSSTVELEHGYESLAGTLDKVNSVEETMEWLASIGYKLSESTPLIGSLKHDGHSVIFEYENGRLAKAMTRGQDGVGKDLTGFFHSALGKDYNLGTCIDIGVAFEATVTWKNLEALNKDNGEDYKSPRSVVGGILKEDGIKYAKYLTLRPLKVHSNDEHLERADELSLINEIIIGSHPMIGEFETFEISSEEELRLYYEGIPETRFELDGMVDGIVIELASEKFRELLGYTDRRANFARALKFPYMEARTHVVDVEWDTDGNSATYTPVARFKPVKLNGHTYKRTSLANFRRFNELDLHKGDSLIFELRGDVLGWLDKIQDENNGTGEKLLAPTHCKCCGEELENDGVFLYCVNEQCDLVRIGNILQFFEKMEIKGVKRETITKMFHGGFLRDVAGIFNINYNKLEKVPGFGKESVAKIRKAIETRLLKKPVYDYEILGSLNLPLISRDRAKLILREISLTDIMMRVNRGMEDGLVEDLKKIHGVKDAIAGELVRGIARKYMTIETLLGECADVRNITDEQAAISTDQPRYAVCVTGNLKGYSRGDFKKALEARGHRMVSGVSKKTDFLVTNNTSSGTEKNADAARLGVRIINEEQAIEILGIPHRSGKPADINEELL